MLYTAKKIADIIGRPPTTIRTWADKYKEYIPLGDKKSGRRLYNDEGLNVFREIEKLHNDGLIGEEVRERLQVMFPIRADGDVIGEQSTGTGLVQYQQFNDMITYLQTKLQKDDELIRLQREELQVLKEQTKLLKEVLDIGRVADTKRLELKSFPTPKKKENKLTKVNKFDKSDTKKRTPQNPHRKKTVVKRVEKKKSWFDKLVGR